MKKDFDIKKIISILLIVAVIIGITTVAAYINFKSDEIGNNVGRTTGKLVGTVSGTVDGIIDGIEKGEKAGIKDGLSAKDTTVAIQRSIGEMGKLEVLIAGVTLRNVNKVGERYAALSIISGEAIFTVDLEQAEINYFDDKKQIQVKIPEPELELYIDQKSTKQLAEVQNFSFTKSAEDGLKSYLNSMAEITRNAKENMGNYESLCKDAKEAAKKQVDTFIRNVTGNENQINVMFK